jgi:transcriptional regulator with GAF, ATPase, and Fis domain
MFAVAPPTREPNKNAISAADLPRLIADLGARLLTEPPATIDHVIATGLRQIIAAIGVDAALLWPAASTSPQVVGTIDATALQSDPPERPHLPAMRFVRSSLAAGHSVFFRRLDDIRDTLDREHLRRFGLRSAAIIPLVPGQDRPTQHGALVFASTGAEVDWTDVIEHLRVVSVVVAQGLTRRAQVTARPKVEQEHQPPRQIRVEGRLPRGRSVRSALQIVSESPSVQRALAQVDSVARTPSTVLLLGETGVGKEVFAQAIHDASDRRHRPMIRVSCAAIPNTLIESELFGRERGAYTGAITRQIGRFEAANQSTIFLDEIGELSPDVQVKLLRVIQERALERLGGNGSVKVDVRIIAATNRNLEQAIADKTFREDLFYRLNVFPIVVPPLRERAEDIPGLVWTFVDELSTLLGKRIEAISPASMQQLQQYSWPGNVRELRNIVERAVITASGPTLEIVPPRTEADQHVPTDRTMRTIEYEHIRATLTATNWRIRGTDGAAERLGLKPTTLETRMGKLGITRPGQKRRTKN